MLKILIVDDNFHNLFLLQSILMDKNISCKTANSGKKAIAELEKSDYNLIFMDIEMPNMNGIETTNYIRTKFNEPKNKIPIIAITAHGLDNEQIKTASFNHVMSKTYNTDKLLEIVNKFTN